MVLTYRVSILDSNYRKIFEYLYVQINLNEIHRRAKVPTTVRGRGFWQFSGTSNLLTMRSFKKLLYGRIVFLKFVVAIVVCFYTYHVIRHYAVWIFANQVEVVSINQNSFRDFISKKRNVEATPYKMKHVKDENKILQFFVPHKVKRFKHEKNYCAPPIGGYVMNMTSDSGTCRIPKLDPFHPHAMKLVEDLSDPLRCETEQRATLSDGVLNITGTDVAYAAYRPIIRPESNDFSFLMGDPVAIASHIFPVPHEYIELTSILTDQKVLKEYLMQVVPRKEITSRPSPASELNLNILIIGIDSISNGHAQRKLPKSYNYIRNILEGYMFMGHSVVGDGTTEQLAAFLTGQGEQEYAESRRGEPNAKPVDKWNWIFKKAKAHGYVTSFCEDSPGVGAFQYRLLGFQDPPTDYYPRAFFLAAEESYSDKNPHCYGSEKIHNYHLNLATKIFEQYPERNKFIFHFPGELSHNNFNAVQLMDNDLLQFLTEFNTKGYLNNTLLILLGDHGWRYGDFRQTVQGKLEERLPLFSMAFPKWFKQKYPTIAKNLRTNTKRLTSWFDLYATFNHLLEYPNKPRNLKHGMSLLSKIPVERSCKDARIPPHWCPCVQWSAVDHKHEHSQQAALTAINHINDLIFHEPLGAKRCSELRLLKLIRAEVETPTTEVLRFSQSGKDGYEPEYSSDKIQQKDRCSYQVTFITLPNHGVFEASVHYVYGRFLVKGSISRINKYGDQPKCIANLLPHIRKYCYCK